MAKVVVAAALARWLANASGKGSGEVALEAAGASVRAVLEAVFVQHPGLRGYLLDDQGALRHHVAIFLDGTAVTDKQHLATPVGERSELYLLQALSGG